MEQLHEVIRHVPKREVREIPREVIKTVPKVEVVTTEKVVNVPGEIIEVRNKFKRCFVNTAIAGPKTLYCRKQSSREEVP